MLLDLHITGTLTCPEKQALLWPNLTGSLYFSPKVIGNGIIPQYNKPTHSLENGEAHMNGFTSKENSELCLFRDRQMHLQERTYIRPIWSHPR